MTIRQVLWVWLQFAKALRMGYEEFMKTILTVSFLLFLTASPAFGQTHQNDPDSNRTESHHQMNYGWVGLAGLLGLLGLRRPKSIEHQRMAAAGIKVSTVPVHLPEHS
jgi:MYXO-CTERM domain-containing protein